MHIQRCALNAKKSLKSLNFPITRARSPPNAFLIVDFPFFFKENKLKINQMWKFLFVCQAIDSCLTNDRINQVIISSVWSNFKEIITSHAIELLIDLIADDVTRKLFPRSIFAWKKNNSHCGLLPHQKPEFLHAHYVHVRCVPEYEVYKKPHVTLSLSLTHPFKYFSF